MKKGEKYDQMIENVQSDALGFFENYYENMAFVQEHIIQLKPKSIYDIGCGTGNLTGPLSNNINVIGIDQSDEMLEQAKTKFPMMETVNEDIQKWTSKANISEGSLIISSFVLHAIEHKEPLMSWFANVINSKSTVIIMDYFFNNESDRLHFIEKLKNDHKEDLATLIESKHYLKIDEIEAWRVKNRFQIKLTMLTHWIGLVELTRMNG